MGEVWNRCFTVGDTNAGIPAMGDEMMATTQQTTSNRQRDFRDITKHLTPTTLAALSVELEAADRSNAVDTFLDCVNHELESNVGNIEAEQLRLWVRENI